MDRPIIFSRPMIRALLNGSKTQTRRLAVTSRLLSEESSPGKYHSRTKLLDSAWKRTQVGDRLWVREAVAWINNSEFDKPSYWEYRADTDGTCFPGDWPPEFKDAPERPRWKPSIHMPREASRLTLLVSGVKVERLQNISNEDAIAEGVGSWRNDWSVKEAATAFLQGLEAAAETKAGSVAQRLFYLLWSEINGRDGWAQNPLVVAITFRVIKANIEALEARAA